MKKLNVNPTRMELTKLKKRLVTARRGHKLLKDKRDELMKRFLELVRENKKLRIQVEEMLMEVNTNFLIARSVMSDFVIEEALMFPSSSISLEVDSENIMSVDVPDFKYKMETVKDIIYPYSLSTTSGELDKAVIKMSDSMEPLILLANREKAAQLLALEIEKTRRRVNALEYVMIPSLENTIRYITMKLEENERGNIVRLMKVKDMMIAEQRAPRSDVK